MGPRTLAPWIIAGASEASAASAVLQPPEFAVGCSTPRDVPLAPILEAGCLSLDSFEYSHYYHPRYCLLSPSHSYYPSLTCTMLEILAFGEGIACLPTDACAVCTLHKGAWLRSRWRLEFNAHHPESWHGAREVGGCWSTWRKACLSNVPEGTVCLSWGGTWRKHKLVQNFSFCIRRTDQTPPPPPHLPHSVYWKGPFQVFTQFKSFLSVFLNDLQWEAYCHWLYFKCMWTFYLSLPLAEGYLSYFDESLFSEVKYTA